MPPLEMAPPAAWGSSDSLTRVVSALQCSRHTHPRPRSLRRNPREQERRFRPAGRIHSPCPRAQGACRRACKRSRESGTGRRTRTGCRCWGTFRSPNVAPLSSAPIGKALTISTPAPSQDSVTRQQTTVACPRRCSPGRRACFRETAGLSHLPRVAGLPGNRVALPGLRGKEVWRLLCLRERKPTRRSISCSLRTTRDSAGLNCRIPGMRKYAHWLILPTDPQHRCYRSPSKAAARALRPV